jgi:hypothetical protein
MTPQSCGHHRERSVHRQPAAVPNLRRVSTAMTSAVPLRHDLTWPAVFYVLSQERGEHWRKSLRRVFQWGERPDLPRVTNLVYCTIMLCMHSLFTIHFIGMWAPSDPSPSTNASCARWLSAGETINTYLETDIATVLATVTTIASNLQA